MEGCIISSGCYEESMMNQKTNGCKSGAWFFVDGRFCRTVLGWTRHEDISEHDILLIAIHLPGHWALVAVKIEKHRQIYYDSLLGDGQICLSLIKKYLEHESMQKGHQEKGPVNWLGLSDKTIPQQSDSYNCGIFVCLCALT
uniref:Ubiquitin-like protease family profile domain-containing protein n=1 Tax=Ditylenchus dipsaci TaxID=166011 RepID=A0A915DHC5_9BILA